MMDLLTVREAAAWLRISESQLRALRAKGVGPKSRSVGKRVVFDKADLEQFVRAGDE
jgi:excisionase family DNA binding protein